MVFYHFDLKKKSFLLWLLTLLNSLLFRRSFPIYGRALRSWVAIFFALITTTSAIFSSKFKLLSLGGNRSKKCQDWPLSKKRSTDLKELSGPLSGYEVKALVENKRCSFFPCGCWLVVVVGVPFLSSWILRNIFRNYFWIRSSCFIE